MAFETGATTTMADFVTKLVTFAAGSAGWTQDQLSTGTGQAAISKGDLYVSFRWNTTSPESLAIYQALGYTGGNSPGNHPDDSGSGLVSSSNGDLDDSRGIYQLGDSLTSYDIFSNETGDDYLRGVVEITPGVFRHFDFGNLDKRGDWTGGEYVTGHIHLSGAPTSTQNSVSMDGLWDDANSNEEFRASTIHVEGLTGQDGLSKWGEVRNSTAYDVELNDRAGNPREMILGGFRGGPHAAAVGWIRSSSANAFVPLYKIGVWHRQETPQTVRLLGYVPDVRGVNIAAFTPRQEVTIGSTTWVVYPVVAKQNTGATDESRNQGIAYAKRT